MLRFTLISLTAIACDIDDIFDGDASDLNAVADRLTPEQIAACIDPDEDDLDEDDCVAGIYVSDNDDSDFDADFLGDGSALTETFTWTNREGAAEYSFEIEAPSAASVVGYAGSTLVEIYDGSGNLLDSTQLVADPNRLEVEYETFLVGDAGDWTIVIEMVGFAGVGSLDLDAEDPDDNYDADGLTPDELAGCIDPDDDDLDEDDCVAGVYVSDNDDSDFDADFLGDGGALTGTFTWTNLEGAADYSIDIEAPSAASTVGYAGSTRVEIYDGSGTLLDATELVADPNGLEVEHDTFLVGEAGDWTVVIDMVDFAGVGSISLSSANPEDR